MSFSFGTLTIPGVCAASGNLLRTEEANVILA